MDLEGLPNSRQYWPPMPDDFAAGQIKDIGVDFDKGIRNRILKMDGVSLGYAYYIHTPEKELARMDRALRLSVWQGLQSLLDRRIPNLKKD